MNYVFSDYPSQNTFDDTNSRNRVKWDFHGKFNS